MSLVDMTGYNRPARAYWFAMVLLGAGVGVWGAYECLRFAPAQKYQLLVLASLMIVSSARPLFIPNTMGSITVSDTFIFLGAIFLGIPAAIVLGVVDSLVGSMKTTRRAATWLVTAAVMAVTGLAAGHVFYLVLALYAGLNVTAVGIGTRLTIEQLLVPLFSMALVQYVTNTLAAATIYALRRRRPVWECWRDGYLWTSWTFCAAAIAAGLIYQAVEHFGLLYVLLSVPVIGATYATYKTYFERVNEKTREVAEMSRLHLATVEALATAIDAKDQSTHYHVRRVQIYAVRMGKLMGLSDGEIKALGAGALLHDVGKLAVPDHILNKTGKLTPAEFEKMKIHTTVGAQILERVGFPYPVVPMVRYHHEQWDGLGYPDGLRGEEIPLTARIFAVVDCFDSAREERPFRRGMTRREACALLRRGAGTHFDPEIVELFLEHLSSFEAEIEAAGLNHHGFTSEECEPRALVEENSALEVAAAATAAAGEGGGWRPPLPRPPGGAGPARTYLDQIKYAHREAYDLYEIARTFGSSLDIEYMATALVEKVGQVVPFTTCAVYLYDEMKNYATVAHAAGDNAELLRGRIIGCGEGAVGFVLANRRPAGQLDPMLDFVGVDLPAGTTYRSMIGLPLVKNERLVGALAVYSIAPRCYTNEHLRLLDTVARLASNALANAIHHAEAESNALTDTLTGLPNARAMQIRFEEEAARARRTGKPFQVVMLDLDNFKQVNDTFGHNTGDQFLREVARILQAQLREYDFLARYAGDEFISFVQDLDAEQIDELRGRIEKAIERFSVRSRAAKHARVGISLGAAAYGVHGETLNQLLIAADEAMYAVKFTRKGHPPAAPARKADDDLAAANFASTAVN